MFGGVSAGIEPMVKRSRREASGVCVGNAVAEVCDGELGK